MRRGSQPMALVYASSVGRPTAGGDDQGVVLPASDRQDLSVRDLTEELIGSLEEVLAVR